MTTADTTCNPGFRVTIKRLGGLPIQHDFLLSNRRLHGKRQECLLIHRTWKNHCGISVGAGIACIMVVGTRWWWWIYLRFIHGGY
jgi:hypothetical protein